MKQKYNVYGMTCSACSSHVDKSVRKLEGVIEVYRRLINEAKKGDNIGILFADTINREEVQRGDKVIK